MPENRSFVHKTFWLARFPYRFETFVIVDLIFLKMKLILIVLKEKHYFSIQFIHLVICYQEKYLFFIVVSK